MALLDEPAKGVEKFSAFAAFRFASHAMGWGRREMREIAAPPDYVPPLSGECSTTAHTDMLRGGFWH